MIPLKYINVNRKLTEFVLAKFKWNSKFRFALTWIYRITQSVKDGYDPDQI